MQRMNVDGTLAEAVLMLQPMPNAADKSVLNRLGCVLAIHNT